MIYDQNGYLDIAALLSKGCIFNFIIGGRGTGKTFGILKHVLDNGLNVFMIRRQQTQVDIVSKPEFNPFRPVDPSVEVRSGSKYHSCFYKDEKCIGYIAALSTFSKIRGFDASDIDIIFYDEFIPELHERPIKNEEAALFNAYETVNRNRELEGKPPVILICAANSNRVDNPVLMGFNLLKDLERLDRKGQELFIDTDRSILLAFLHESPISRKKNDTALYNALHGDKFVDMSIGNRFSFSRDRIKSLPLQQYKLIIKVGSLGIYANRSDNNQLYIRKTKETAKYNFSDDPDGVKNFRQTFGVILLYENKENIIYEDLDTYTRFRHLLT